MKVVAYFLALYCSSCPLFTDPPVIPVLLLLNLCTAPPAISLLLLLTSLYCSSYCNRFFFHIKYENSKTLSSML